MKSRFLLSAFLFAAGAAGPQLANATEPTNEVTVINDITNNVTWYNTNVYFMDGYIHVLAPAELTIEPGTIIKGLAASSITSGEPASALFITAGAKIHATGTPLRPIIFTSEFDNTDDPNDMGIYERGKWGGVVVFGSAILNTASSTTGNTNNPKYDLFEGIAETVINGQNVYRFGGNNDADNSGEIQYVSIRHGGYVFQPNKELNGLSMCALGSNTVIDHVEAYAIADDGFEFFGGTVNTKYLVSAFNDDDTFDTDQGYRGKNQFWFSIQEDGARDNGGEWNGEPNGIAVSNAPFANFQLYNATFIGAGNLGTNAAANHGLTIREYSAPRMYNSVLTDFTTVNSNPSIGVNISDVRSKAMLTAGLLDFRENIVNGFGTKVTNANSAILFSDASRSNTTVSPLLTAISRSTNHLLDPRLGVGSPALSTTVLPPNDGFYEQVAFKGAFDNCTLWLRGWTALDSMGFLPTNDVPTEPTNEVTVINDITNNVTWYNTNVYFMDGYIHVLAPAELTIEPGTIIKGLAASSITSGEPASALFITAGAKIHATGTPLRPIIFTSEFDNTDDPNDMGIYERGKWGGVVVFGSAILNTASSTTGNTNNPKYDLFEGIAETVINGQNVYRFGGNNDADNSGEIQYVSIRHGGYVFQPNKELNGLSMCALGSNTVIDHVEAYAIADDGFEFFGGTVNTKYLVSAFNDDDTFDTDQGYRGKNQFWFSIQEDGARDNGGEWNGEPNGIAVSNAPFANFQLYNATFIGAGNLGTNAAANHGLTIREYSAPRMYNSVLTDFTTVNSNPSIGVNISDVRSKAMLTAGLLDFRENIVNGFGTKVTNANSAILFSDASRSNTTVSPLLTAISRSTNHLLDPRIGTNSPAQNTSILPANNGFYKPVSFKGAFNRDLWINKWTALSSMGFLPAVDGTVIRSERVTTPVPPAAPTLTITPSGGNALVTYSSEPAHSYQLRSRADLATGGWSNEGGLQFGTGGTLTNTVPIGPDAKFFQVEVQ